jgi:hypothetical protein
MDGLDTDPQAIIQGKTRIAHDPSLKSRRLHISPHFPDEPLNWPALIPFEL